MIKAQNDITILKLNIAISDQQWPHGLPSPLLLPSFSFMPICGHRKSDQTHQKRTKIVPILNNGSNSDHGPNFGPHSMLWWYKNQYYYLFTLTEKSLWSPCTALSQL